jgi:hypothetical protein
MLLLLLQLRVGEEWTICIRRVACGYCYGALAVPQPVQLLPMH